MEESCWFNSRITVICVGDQLKIRFEPTDKEVCWMCHLSSGCLKCCKICNARCNAGQFCMIGVNNQSDRFESWRFLTEVDVSDHISSLIHKISKK